MKVKRPIIHQEQLHMFTYATLVSLMRFDLIWDFELTEITGGVVCQVPVEFRAMGFLEARAQAEI